MGLKLKQLFQSISNFLTAHQASLVSSVLVVGSLWGESAFDSIWNCPCTISSRVTYTCLFTFTPAAFIFLLGILLDKLTWQIFQGSECCFIKRCCDWNIFILLMRSLLAPAVWFLCIALDGRYYDCAASEVPCEQAFVNYNGTEVHVVVEAWLKHNGDDVYIERTITSQIYGWGFLMGVICLATLVTCCVRCHSKSTVLHDKYAEIHQAVESDLLEQFMKENAYHEADLNIRRFMAQRVATKGDWNEISSPPLLCVAPGTSSHPPTYTRLQEWAETRLYEPTINIGLNDIKFLETKHLETTVKTARTKPPEPPVKTARTKPPEPPVKPAGTKPPEPPVKPAGTKPPEPSL